LLENHWYSVNNLSKKSAPKSDSDEQDSGSSPNQKFSETLSVCNPHHIHCPTVLSGDTVQDVRPSLLQSPS